jgi:mono/diheme cytochrome c family protein
VAFIGAGHVLTRRPDAGAGAGSEAGSGAAGSGGIEVSPQTGKRLFWTRARCSTCHRLGELGSNPRGPDLGDGEQGPAIGARAEARARERSQQTGRPFSATDYLVESLLEPGAYLVSGYKNEMAPAHEPPVDLGPDEIRALVTYLQSLGGRVDLTAIRLPAVLGDGTRVSPARKE